MFKIGDFSRLAQVSTRMLRHYDQLGLLKPSQTDEWTGYRYYTIDQLPRLHRLIALKEMGFSLEQVAGLLEQDEVPVEQLRGMLRLRQAELEREIREGQFRLAEVESRLQQIELAGQPSPYEIVVKSIDPQPVASVRQLVPHVAEMDFFCESLYASLYQELRRLRIRPVGPEITIYHAEEYRETDLDVEAAVVVGEGDIGPAGAGASLEFRTAPGADLAAALIYEGPFAEIVPAVLELLRWVGTHQHAPAGSLRELHLSGPAHVDGKPVESAVVELQLPIAPIHRD
jgi:DNA-binding transcriptional MerR regulator/effector-binding domain-containing protein